MSPPVQELPTAYKLVHAYCLPLRGRLGDVCERRLRRKKRAKRSGGIKAIGKRASPAQTEPLIQQNMSQPYIGCFVYRGAFSRVDCEERSDVVAQPFVRNER